MWIAISFSSSSEEIKITNSQILCGNLELDAGEQCDDGNTQNGDTCTADCQIAWGLCGDGKVQAELGEQCDAGNKNGKKGIDCDGRCLFPILDECGDGFVHAGMEQCDAGNRNGDTGDNPCRSNCMLPTCGDGIVDAAKEQCDDHNRLNGDGCDTTCHTENSASTGTKASAIPVPVIADVRPAAELLPPRIPTPARTPTGPGLVIFLASGAAAGWGMMRKKRK
jgi:cysteine-rich repeat protein